MKKVIVTGANGFIGSHLCKELSQYGVRIIAILQNKESNAESIKSIPNIEIVYCEMENYLSLVEKIKDKDIDTFYHLAWRGVFRDKKSDYRLQTENCKNTIDAAFVSKALGCKKFVSTGTMSEFPVMELISKKYFSPNMIYAITKHYTYNLLKVYCIQNNIDFVWATLANVYGFGNITGNVISYVIENLIRNKPLNLSKADYYYDFIYIKDCAKMLRLIGENKTIYDNYYIGSGEPKILSEYFNAIKNLINPNACLGIGNIQGDNIEYKREWFNIERIEQEFHFTADYTFTEGINEILLEMNGKYES